MILYIYFWQNSFWLQQEGFIVVGSTVTLNRDSRVNTKEADINNMPELFYEYRESDLGSENR